MPRIGRQPKETEQLHKMGTLDTTKNKLMENKMTTTAKLSLDTDYYITYELRGIPYVPHYTKDCYVGPNYSAFEGVYDLEGDKCYFTSTSREYSAKELELIGAKKVVRLLWKRSKQKPVAY